MKSIFSRERRALLFVLKGYLKASRRGILSFFSFFSVLGIFIGVAALIIVIGVMTGFHNELKKRILGISPHIYITRFYDVPFKPTDSLLSIIKEEEELSSAIPYIMSKGMIRKGIYTDGVLIKGIIPNTLPIWEEIEKMIKMGKPSLKRGEILLGVGLASALRILPEDTIKLYLAKKEEGLGLGFKSKSFTVTGIFDSGLYDYNTSLVFVNLDDLRELTGLGESVSGIEVYIKDPYKAERVAKRIEKKVGYPFRASSWISLNKSLFSALKLEKLGMFIILFLLVIVASFGIVVTLLLLVTNKTREIGVLRAMGMKEGEIQSIFMGVGIIMGLIGTLSGCIFGFFVGEIFDKFKLVRLPPDVYFIDRLPIKVEIGDILLIAAGAILIVLLATFFPSKRASKLKPADAIRYE